MTFIAREKDAITVISPFPPAATARFSMPVLCVSLVLLCGPLRVSYISYFVIYLIFLVIYLFTFYLLYDVFMKPYFFSYLVSLYLILPYTYILYIHDI